MSCEKELNYTDLALLPAACSYTIFRGWEMGKIIRWENSMEQSFVIIQRRHIQPPLSLTEKLIELWLSGKKHKEKPLDRRCTKLFLNKVAWVRRTISGRETLRPSVTFCFLLKAIQAARVRPLCGAPCSEIASRQFCDRCLIMLKDTQWSSLNMNMKWWGRKIWNKTQ